MRAKFILPSLTEAKSPFFRPIKYSLFPPLGLATLAAYLSDSDEIILVDEHVEILKTDDEPDLVLIQVYITNAYRAYKIADEYRKKGVYVVLGGLHVTSLPDEAEIHADTIFLGPAEQTFPLFIEDFRKKLTKKRYISTHGRTLSLVPHPRRDLIKREKYLVPNSIVFSRGCPHHCDFCYKDAFYKGGKSFYTEYLDRILEEIHSLGGKHLYFLDDHLFGNPKLSSELFVAMKGMGRVFQGAATLESIIKSDLIEKAAEAGLGSIFIGFETFSESSLIQGNKQHNINKDYEAVVKRLHSLDIKINGSFVFGLDGDTKEVFKRTVDWGIEKGLTTATFHIFTPYPGTRLFEKMETEGRIISKNWDLYDTRHTVYKLKGMQQEELEEGYHWAYREFYTWRNIIKSSNTHKEYKQKLKHFLYTGGWKKFEGFWRFIVNAGGLAVMLPVLEILIDTGKEEIKNKTSIH
ncbi:MAG: B12-binding domain-containing radical SAM protein [Leptospiraceae bacterium]|nr:B12-binding domain-containing radical SAM protein [Leptospiraceae bacterium]MCP5501678.1 B12-binding domain-containing radical SAM protein [Leptospiraceae bacterium]